ncbi:MAG TPA: putative dsRNA-binding protein [Phycisphaerae bacterium]|nr:putative dsRNA-binding protein [Phycisphaerae bacterium]
MELIHQNESQENAWLFHRTPWEPEFLSRFPRVTQTLRIACPFIKIRSIRLILASLPSRPQAPIHVKLLTRLNAPDCRARVHDIAAIELLRSNPLDDRCRIDVRINNALHAKCFIFDTNEVIITSSNLTFAAFYKNLEVAIALSNPEVITTSTQYFDEIFDAASPVSDAMLESVKSRLPFLPPAEVCISPEPAVIEAPPIAPVDDASADFPELDPSAVQKLDEALSQQLERDLDKSCIFLSSPDGQSAAAESENSFFQDMASRFSRVFSGVQPTNDELAVIFVHASARQSLKSVNVDLERAAHLECIGRHALTIIIIESLLQASSRSIDAGTLTSKMNYIAASDHCVRKFHEAGLAQVLLDVSMTSSSEAFSRGRALILKKTIYRMVGYLALSRPWEEIANVIIATLEIAESFPFESYRDHNYKRELQNATQQAGAGRPIYKLSGREGRDDDPSFIVDVIVRNKIVGQGRGTPMKIAEMRAAFDALKAFRLDRSSSRATGGEPVKSATLAACSRLGLSALRTVTSRDIGIAQALYVLLPTGSPRTEFADKREGLSVLGGVVRELLAYFQCYSDGCGPTAATSRANYLNKKERVVKCIRQSPLLGWIKELVKDNQFRTAGDPSVVNETVNVCFAVLFAAGGIETCRGLASYLFRDTSVDVSQEIIPAKVRLLQALQAAFRERVKELLKFELKPLHKLNQSHDPLFQVRVVFDGKELGRGTGKSRRIAEEVAAECALINPLLQQLLSSAVASSSDSSSAAGGAEVVAHGGI